MSQGLGYAVCGMYLIDAHFMVDPSKFVSGCLLCLSTMVSLVSGRAGADGERCMSESIMRRCEVLSRRGQ